MTDPIFSALKVAGDGMGAQSYRLKTVHENLSNVDTPGYHRKMVTFTSQAGDRAVDIERITLDRSEGRMVLDPGHPLADENGYVAMSNVDMMVEMTDAREAKRHFEANLEAFRQARDMYSGLVSLLRSS
ncbi:flagellar basal body rod C-terminal domain-containing protein [Parvularcula sp. LCG005]|uniref:flagellar basal body rod C-terminal domain-containing protein n=1 Tax=Parvularcula sp. LCG005 TaxID=3078805 RepID=UPI002941C2B0|nr:flagellar basal body rod C-terminal domain-containing protein [Parvularcula sp. LCG005]WOI52678.1 flagellar basal body rod C-terminal domain-containing protein [Parvularcula sp. LCG005]